MRERPGIRPLPGGTLSDEDIVARVRAGEVELFELLMRRHNQRLYRAVRGILRDGPELEDVLQQAWLSAYLKLGHFEGRSRVSTWLHRIAQNAALDRVRRPVRLVPAASAPDPVSDAESDPEHTLLARERARALERAFDALPETQRRVFVLREVEGLSTAETAECLGVEEGVVKMRLHRARARLRQRLGRDAEPTPRDVFGFAGARCDALVSAVLAHLPIRPPA